MTIADWFLLAIRWLHLLAGAAWVGGSIFFYFVLRPALQGTTMDGAVSRVAGQEFRNLVDVCITVLLATGTVLSIIRLTTGYATPAYGAVLGVKIALSVWMFYLVWFRQRRRPQIAGQQSPPQTNVLAHVARSLNANNLLLAFGVIVFLLADLLRALYEQALEG